MTLGGDASLSFPVPREGCPVSPGSALQKVLYLTPTLSSNMDRRGIALDGHLKNIHTNLASSTL